MSSSRASPALGMELDPPPTPRLSAIALFADLDGTLAPIEDSPGAVKPDAQRRRLLDALTHALSGRLAVISGRALGDLDRVLEGRVMAVAAVHGLVRRSANGRLIQPPSEGRMGEALGEIRAFAAGKAGLLVEDKGAAVALHYRHAPWAREACRAIVERLAGTLGLTVQEGDKVIELRTAGADKGVAVRAFMAESPFSGSMPIYLGDDLTDEHGFAAARALGGFGVVVGPRRPTGAGYALADVTATKTWLQEALEAAT